MEQKQPNKDYINQSLINQIARLSMQVAERDAVITEQTQENQELQQELDKLKKEHIQKLDEES